MKKGNKNPFRFLVGWILFFSIPASLVGDWARGEHQILLGTGFSALRTEEFYSPGGKKIQINPFSDYSVNIFGEYGVTDHWTAAFSLPFKRLHVETTADFNRDLYENETPYYGLGDLVLGNRYQFWKTPDWLISAGLNIGVPTGYARSPLGLNTGDGEYNFHPFVSAVYSWNAAGAYTRLNAGYNLRTVGFSDEIVFGGLVGWAVLSGLKLEIGLEWLISTQNGDEGEIRSGALYTNNASYLLYRPGLVWEITPRQGLYTHMAAGTLVRNTLAAPVFSAGYFVQF